MRIRPGGVGDKAQWLASGVVVARIVLPVGVDVKLDVASVFPDVIIFDGEVPDEVVAVEKLRGFETQTKRTGRHDDDENEDEIPPPPEMPLPDPLPERAFGHLRPDGWVAAVSEREDPNAAEEVVYAVSAKVVDVPLEVLPGRQKEFRSFVSKVSFGAFLILKNTRFRLFAVPFAFHSFQLSFSLTQTIPRLYSAQKVQLQVY